MLTNLLSSRLSPHLKPSSTTHLLIFVVLFFTVAIGLWKNKNKTLSTKVTDPHQAAVILRNSTLESRTPPNRRLRSTFHINNSFTTFSPRVHQEFRSHAVSHMRITRAIISTAGLIVNGAFEELDGLSAERGAVRLIDLIRVLVLQLVLGQFHLCGDWKTVRSCWEQGGATRKQRVQKLMEVGAAIETLWVKSKSGLEDKELYQQLRMNLSSILGNDHHICHSFGGSESHLDTKQQNDQDADNPLNMLLPAYETLWRVVLAVYLYIHDNPAYVKDFRFEPGSLPQSEDSETIPPPTLLARAIIHETLRLVPPTRSIYRWLPNVGKDIAISVQNIQRSSYIWGENACNFLPERWMVQGQKEKRILRMNIKLGWLPFGGAGMTCPAAAGFAVSMVSIIVGALTQGVGEKVKVKGTVELDADGVLKGGRGAQGGLVVHREVVTGQLQ